ncbi:MAG: class I SAM-dependent methyltransferase [Desulfobacteraceae bacterium]|nr:class I SAM-dependent methyltransferase [Desulfobacteraceae bacterium]
MSFTLKNVVPWGRSFDEYVAMFSLSGADLRKRILGCGDGPASFNALLSMQGGQILSADPLYRFSPEDIRNRISETYAKVMEQMRKNKHEFIWTSIKSVEKLGQIRMAAMDKFLADYPQGLEQGRYLEGKLPHLPFADQEFDLAVCSHFLFLYSEQYSDSFHVASIRELCRVASEVRIFPLLELGSKISRHLQVVIDSLSSMGYLATIIPVYYEFQRGGNKMMKIRSVEPGRGNQDAETG